MGRCPTAPSFAGRFAPAAPEQGAQPPAPLFLLAAEAGARRRAPHPAHQHTQPTAAVKASRYAVRCRAALTAAAVCPPPLGWRAGRSRAGRGTGLTDRREGGRIRSAPAPAGRVPLTPLPLPRAHLHTLLRRKEGHTPLLLPHGEWQGKPKAGAAAPKTGSRTARVLAGARGTESPDTSGGRRVRLGGRCPPNKKRALVAPSFYR